MPNLDVVALITAEAGSEAIVEEPWRHSLSPAGVTTAAPPTICLLRTRHLAHLSPSRSGSRRRTSTHTWLRRTLLTSSLLPGTTSMDSPPSTLSALWSP